MKKLYIAALFMLVSGVMFAQQNATPAKEKQPDIESAAYRLNTMGVFVGTTFAAPVFTATVQGTYAPWKSSFFELGMDLGLGSGDADVEHFSLYPYAHYAFFVPFTNANSVGAGSPARAGGWYAGAGAGYMFTSYTFPEGKITGNIFAADISAGLIFGNGITLSYTLRTDFATASNKLAVGYSYRFK